MPLLFIPPWPSSFLVFYPYSSTKGPNPLTQFHGGPVIFRMPLLIITGAHHHCPRRSSPPHESPRHPLHRPLLSTLTFNPSSGTMPLSQYMLTLPMWAYLPSPPLFHSQLELGLLHQSLLLERKLRQRCHETQPGKKLHDVLSMKFCLYGAQVTPTKCPPSYSWKTLANFSLCLRFPERDFPESEAEQTPLSRHLFPPLTPVPPLYRGCCM